MGSLAGVIPLDCSSRGFRALLVPVPLSAPSASLIKTKTHSPQLLDSSIKNRNYDPSERPQTGEIYGIVSLINSEQFAENPPQRRIGKPSNVCQNMVCGIWIFGYVDIWMFGYLDVWICGYLDSGQNTLLLHPNPDFCVVQPCRGLFSPEKTHPCIPGVFATPNSVFCILLR